jgi:hypothetical protein
MIKKKKATKRKRRPNCMAIIGCKKKGINILTMIRTQEDINGSIKTFEEKAYYCNEHALMMQQGLEAEKRLREKGYYEV